MGTAEDDTGGGRDGGTGGGSALRQRGVALVHHDEAERVNQLLIDFFTPTNRAPLNLDEVTTSLEPTP